MSYNNRGPPGSNGRRPDLQQYSPALTARTQDTFSASTAQNSYNRDSPALTARTQNRSSASTTPSSSQRDPALTARTQSSSSASTTRLQQASSTPGYAGGNGHPLIDVESMSPDRILRLLREYRLIKVLVYSNNATALTFQVVDDRAHDAMAKLLREKQVRIIPGGFRVQQQQRPADRPTPKERMRALWRNQLGASERMQAMSFIVIELWDIHALTPLASAMACAAQCCGGGVPCKDNGCQLGITEHSPLAEVATLMNGMLQDAEDFAYQMERLSKEDGEVCGQLAWHSEKLIGMLKELFVLGWHMQRGKDDLVERWRVDHNTGRPQPSGRALR